MKIKKVAFSQGKKYYWKEGDLHTSNGLIKEKDMKKSKATSNKNKIFLISDANFLDNYDKIKRGPQIMTKKDIGTIITNLGIDKNSKVLEIGSGSGALTIYLANIAKEVTTYEIREDHEKIVKKNIESFGIKNVKQINKDASKEIKEKGFTAATIDVKEPWTVIDNVEKSLNSGSLIASYSPSINQVTLLLEKIKEKKNLIPIKTLETLEREWDTLKLHPKFQMLGHTAFITIIRKI